MGARARTLCMSTFNLRLPHLNGCLSNAACSDSYLRAQRWLHFQHAEQYILSLVGRGNERYLNDARTTGTLRFFVPDPRLTALKTTAAYLDADAKVLLWDVLRHSSFRAILKREYGHEVSKLHGQPCDADCCTLLRASTGKFTWVGIGGGHALCSFTPHTGICSVAI